MERASNQTDVDVLSKLLRGNVPALDERQFMKSDMDEVAEIYIGFLVDLRKVTPRANKTMLKNAALKAFPSASVATCESFGRQLSLCFSHCIKSSKMRKLVKDRLLQ